MPQQVGESIEMEKSEMIIPGVRIKLPSLRADRRNRISARPSLESGDRLTREEFERRYEARPDVKKAELIEGVVYMASPVRSPHSEGTADMNGVLWTYSVSTPGTRCHDNGTVRLDNDNEPQPDAALRLVSGGTSRVSEDEYVEGAPELVVEVAMSSAAYDLRGKLQAYRRNGVKEYIVWQLAEGKLQWFRLQAGEYVEAKPDKSGVIESTTFPGLRLKVKALLNGKTAEVLAELQKGLASPEHAAFVAEISGKKRKSSKKASVKGRAKKR